MDYRRIPCFWCQYRPRTELHVGSQTQIRPSDAAGVTDINTASSNSISHGHLLLGGNMATDITTDPATVEPQTQIWPSVAAQA